MDPSQVIRDANGVMRCRECGFSYDLDRREVANRAGSAFAAVQAAVAATPEERRSVRPSPEVWSVNAYAQHLVDAAAVINLRVRAIAETDRPELPYHDQDRAVEEERADEVPATDSLARLEESVQAFQWYLTALPPEAWQRTGIHSRAGEVRLADIAHDMTHELEHHAQDIRRIGVGQTRRG
jgi:hypothetical protein